MICHVPDPRFAHVARVVSNFSGSDAASATGKYGEYLTPAEAREVLFDYIKTEGLDHPTV